MNGLALVTAIWLEDVDETLYSAFDESEAEWRKITMRYLACMYDCLEKSLNKSRSTKEIHQNMMNEVRAMKKLSIQKWIEFLEMGHLSQALAQS